MGETKTYVFGNDANTASNNLLASILPALQNRGIDSSYLMGLMSGNNNGGFFGNNGGFQDIIALIVIAAIFGNGNFGFGNWGNNGNNSAEREMIMSAIQRNGVDLSQLASTLNCSVGRLDDAIGQVATSICSLGNQMGQSTNQIITALMQGNNALTAQICQCCCDTKQLISESNYLTERGFCNTNQILSKGFSDIGYATQSQTCSIEKSIAASTQAILEGQRAAELREMQDKMDALREKNAQQAVILNNAQQTSQFAAMLAPITEDLASIKCKLPKTEVVNVQPDYIPVNRGVNISYAPYYCGGYNAFGGYGWNGCQNGSLWG